VGSRKRLGPEGGQSGALELGLPPDDPAVTINTTPFEKADLPRIVGDYDVIIDDHSYVPTDLARQCKSLKHVVFLGTGAASYMNVDELKSIGINVHTIKGYGDTAVAEQAIALMMAACRDLARMDRTIRAGTWQPLEGMQIFGKTLGIGAEVARIAKGMGMEVIAWNRTPRPEAGVKQVLLDELLAKSDVISINLVLNDETRGFIGTAKIAAMKPGVILVNTARGAIVDEAALIDGLKRGHIRHAGLDVFHNEPLKGTEPIVQLPNVTLAAHAAFRTLEASMTLLRRALDIVKKMNT